MRMIPVSFANATVMKEIDIAHALCGRFGTKECVRNHKAMNRVLVQVNGDNYDWDARPEASYSNGHTTCRWGVRSIGLYA